MGRRVKGQNPGQLHYEGMLVVTYLTEIIGVSYLFSSPKLRQVIDEGLTSTLCKLARYISKLSLAEVLVDISSNPNL